MTSLLALPEGEKRTTTFSKLALRAMAGDQAVKQNVVHAERIGAPKAVRAVAQACAANHIAVAIPCHRVVRRDGDIAGYRWGVDRKRELLRREAEA